MKHLPPAISLALMFGSQALAQTIRPRFGEPGAFSAFWKHAGVMLSDPIFLAITVISLLIFSRAFTWLLLPIGGVTGAVAVVISANFSVRYSSYYMSTGPFWAAAAGVGMGLALLAVVGMGFFGKRE